MAANLVESCDTPAADEEYIDMEVTSYYSTTFFSSPSPANPREFEFQMSSSSLDQREPTTSPADELFYKGKLLPLHLPPRLQMVEKLLQNSSSSSSFSGYGDRTTTDQFYTHPPPLTSSTLTTPFHSCTISPSESCQVSGELNPEEFIIEYYSTSTDENYNLNKSRTKKLKLIKHLSLAASSKLKASTAYIRSFFRKPASYSNSDDSSNSNFTSAAKVADEGSLLNHVKLPKKLAPFGQISTSVNNTGSFHKEKIIEEDGDNGGCHRRSFSVSIKRQQQQITKKKKTTMTTTTTSSSSSSTGFHALQFLKRSSSTNSDMENSIQGAIAHCKQSQSQQVMMCSRKSSVSHEIGFYSLSAAVCDDQERVEICRG